MATSDPDPEPSSPSTTSTSSSSSPSAPSSPTSLRLPSSLDALAGTSSGGSPLRGPISFGDFASGQFADSVEGLAKSVDGFMAEAVQPPVGPQGVMNAVTNPAPAAFNGEGTVIAASGIKVADVDMDLFLRNKNELNVIRAQLQELKGRERADFQRRGFVEGRKYKTNYAPMAKNPARKVFDNIPKPNQPRSKADIGHAGPSQAKGPPSTAPRKAWVAVVCSNLEEKKFQLVYRPPREEDGEVIVDVSDESKAMAHSRWSDYLVGYFLEGRLSFPSVESIAKQMWAKQGLVETLCFNKEFFFFKVPDASSRGKLLDHGPFLFGGRPLILQQWTPSLKLNKVCHSKIPLWVTFHNIPLTMWNPTGLGDIASAIGVPLYADHTTEKLQRFDFARICVEVDAAKPLLDEIKLRDEDGIVPIRVEYQWRPKRCLKCCTFGHFCTELSNASKAPSSSTAPSSLVQVPSSSVLPPTATVAATDPIGFSIETPQAKALVLPAPTIHPSVPGNIVAACSHSGPDQARQAAPGPVSGLAAVGTIHRLRPRAPSLSNPFNSLSEPEEDSYDTDEESIPPLNPKDDVAPPPKNTRLQKSLSLAKDRSKADKDGPVETSKEVKKKGGKSKPPSHRA